MKSCFFIAAIFVACPSFIRNASYVRRHFQHSATIIDFSVQRLSGDRVFISWHTEREGQEVQYEVMRQDGRISQYFSVDVVNPDKQKSVTAISDYSYIDINHNPDSSYYRIKKKTANGVVFFSIPKGVEGVGKRHG